VQLETIAVQVVERGQIMHIPAGPHELDQAGKLTWKIKIVVLGEIDEVSIGLIQKYLELLAKSLLVACLVEFHQNELRIIEIFGKKSFVFGRAAVQYCPDFDS
jgi:hypothetical protein